MRLEMKKGLTIDTKRNPTINYKFTNLLGGRIE